MFVYQAKLPPAQALASPVRLCQLTLAQLPTHFLMPFASTVERSDRVKIRLEPGSRVLHRRRDKETLSSTSYMLNRYDAVRHLQRQHHWHDLVTDRQRASVGRMARKGNTYGPKFLREHYVWEDAVEPAREVLEQDVMRAIQALDAEALRSGSEAPTSIDNTACVLDLTAPEVGVEAPASSLDPAKAPKYTLGVLLSDTNLDAMREHLTPSTGNGLARVLASPAATQVLLALDKLQVFTSATSIMKRMPMVQNPPGTRQKMLEEREQATDDTNESGRDDNNTER